MPESHQLSPLPINPTMFEYQFDAVMDICGSLLAAGSHKLPHPAPRVKANAVGGSE